MTTPDYPLQPEPSLDSAPFWASLKAGTLAIQRCTNCRQWQFPPLETCRHCRGELVQEPLSGRGTIHTYIVEHRRVAPGFDHLLPYAIALVAPEEAPQVRLPGRIVDKPEAVSIGAAVEAEIVDVAGSDYKVAVFRLTAPGDQGPES
jgi:uncharacterized OB-fold protein